MALIECRKCGQLVSDKADFCSVCGAPVGDDAALPGIPGTGNTIICRECGFEYSENQVCCPECGNRHDVHEIPTEKNGVEQPIAEPSQEPDNKIVCSKCGFEYSDRESSCPECGCRHEVPEVPSEEDNSEVEKPIVDYLQEINGTVETDEGKNRSRLLFISVVSIIILAVICTMTIISFSEEAKRKAALAAEQHRADSIAAVERERLALLEQQRRDSIAAAAAEAERRVFKNRTFALGDVSFKMVAVSGGNLGFVMGATHEQNGAYDDEKPVHSVILSNYYIGESEVTQSLWLAVMGNNPSHFQSGNNPVEKVSYDECMAFICKLNDLLAAQLPQGCRFRLPTEAEWEFAARGGAKRHSYIYSGDMRVDEIAWYKGNSAGSPSNVKQKEPNELGLYDMSGNVYEWCSDWYDRDYYSISPEKNPQGPDTGTHRVIRGGSWDLPERHCRISLRNYCKPDAKGYSNGLRLALDAYNEPEETTVDDNVSDSEKVALENIIKNICHSLNESKYKYQVPYSPELKSMLDKARNIADSWAERTGGYDDFIDEQYFISWIDAQDFETLSFEIIQYERVSDKSLHVYVQLTDSWLGPMDLHRIEFVRLDGDWVIEDINKQGYRGGRYKGEGISQKEIIKKFIERHKDKLTVMREETPLDSAEIVDVEYADDVYVE